MICRLNLVYYLILVKNNAFQELQKACTGNNMYDVSENLKNKIRIEK